MYRRRGGLNARAAHKVQAPQGVQGAPQGGQAAPPGAQPQPQDGTLQSQQVRSYFGTISKLALINDWPTFALDHRSIQIHLDYTDFNPQYSDARSSPSWSKFSSSSTTGELFISLQILSKFCQVIWNILLSGWSGAILQPVPIPEWQHHCTSRNA